MWFLFEEFDVVECGFEDMLGDMYSENMMLWILDDGFDLFDDFEWVVFINNRLLILVRGVDVL